ncbi:signal peptidase I [Microbacterium sp.]|uniref:signal peptidase I n=1 Tax=Microbacterium sp. TaxID=51671 RepID=UPI0025CE6864|nr:signal peptidase I [Microbacterium sp.]MBT9606336.1 signal peptidase I [Microbacterium sp.]
MTSSADTTAPPTRWRRVRRSPLTHLALALLLLALVQGFVIKPFQVPSESMSPTLETGDRILASRIAYSVSAPGAGDIAVFSRPESWGPTAERSPLRIAVGWVGDIVGFGPSNHDALVKRIVGEPGSTVRCCTDQGAVEVNGIPLAEEYVVNDLPFTPGVSDCTTTPLSPRCFGPITVPADEFLVMGDNRANSADSVIACRGIPSASAGCARFVPRGDMLGKVVSIVWPLDRLRLFSDGG